MNDKDKQAQSVERLRIEIIYMALQLLHDVERQGPGTAPASVREMPRLRAVNE